MRRSRIVAPVHIVWATRDRLPLITAEIEEALHRCICSEAEKMGAEVLAVGGIPERGNLFPRLQSTRLFTGNTKTTDNSLGREKQRRTNDV
jgi:transposase